MSNKCPKCDTDNPEAVKFCGECGTQLPSLEDIEVTETMETPKEELSTGSTFAGRYQIIEELGKGGMGKVYKVHDTKIKEKIALKLIKPEIAKDKKTLERFSNELKFARKIRHKNICQMFDLGEENETHFITMEFVEGQDLKKLIRQTGQLAIGTTINIAKQVCDGLDEAHKLGVVHRDLKPSNIMIDADGNARIMDFGIARSIEGKGITGAGVMIGTPEYMSPEQVEGKEVDQRSDVYSLGVILYEMVTGQVPFEGDTPFTIGVKHKSETPKNPKELNANLSDDLSSLILRCLEKDKGERYQGAEEVSSELANIEKGIPTTERAVPEKKSITSKEITVTFGSKKVLVPALLVIAIVIVGLILWKPWALMDSSPPGEQKPSIAVLPFKDLSPQMDQQHLCSGIPSDLVQRLTQVEDLWIPAWASSSSFNAEDMDIKELGSKLNVDTVLTGTLQKADDRLRITVELINIADNNVIWTERYERDEGGIFELQDEVSLAIIDKLKVKLLREEKSGLVKRNTDNAKAYNLYLLGRHFWNKRTGSDMIKSIEYFEQAIEVDPGYALAYAGIADAYVSMGAWRFLPEKEAYPKAREQAQKALEIDSMLAEAYSSLGAVKFEHEWDWSGAEKYYRQAIELNPNYPTAHQWYSEFLASMGRFDEAFAEIQIAQELDPLSPIIYVAGALVYYYSRQYEKAQEMCQKALELDPNFRGAYHYLANIHLQKQNYDEFFSERKKYMILEGANPQEIAQWEKIFEIYKTSGTEDAARYTIDVWKKAQELEDISPARLVAPYVILKDKEKLMNTLERCYQERTQPIVVLKVAPDFDFIRSEPRFKALLKKVGLDT
jgi:serine/threonine protein kinase/tetratricopeptide (TPR) repeat protein